MYVCYKFVKLIRITYVIITEVILSVFKDECT